MNLITANWKQYFWLTVGNLRMPRANCMHCSMPFYLRDFSICRFWYLQGVGVGPGTNLLTDIEGGLYFILWRSGRSRKIWREKLIVWGTGHTSKNKASLYQFNPPTLQSIPCDVTIISPISMVGNWSSHVWKPELPTVVDVRFKPEKHWLKVQRFQWHSLAKNIKTNKWISQKNK